MAARGLAETLASVVWASESPERLVSLVRTDLLRNKALLDAARRKYPGFGDTYSTLSRIAHPNRDAHLLTPWPTRHPPRTVTPFNLGFSDDFAQKKIAILVMLGPSSTSELTSLLAQSPDISKRDKVMLEIVFSSDATPKHL